jgi:FKBP-type peptidyl-prolyl cis-trans isomerase
VLTLKPLTKLAPTIAFVLLSFAPAAQAQREKLPPEDLEFVEKTWPEAKKTSTGIRYIVMHEGGGDTAKPGDKVDVLYVGRLLNGKTFDQALDREHPFSLRVRRNEVIEGWDQVLQFMKKGEKRLVIIPPELAYGTRGQPPSIPRSATLVFEMEILAINGK